MDREKVLKGIDICGSTKSCEKCPFDGNLETISCTEMYKGLVEIVDQVTEWKCEHADIIINALKICAQFNEDLCPNCCYHESPLHCTADLMFDVRNMLIMQGILSGELRYE